MEILRHIPFEIALDALFEKVRLPPDGGDGQARTARPFCSGGPKSGPGRPRSDSKEIAMLSSPRSFPIFCFSLLLLAGCASQGERNNRKDLDREKAYLEGRSAEWQGGVEEKAELDLGADPGLEDFLRYAALNHPGLRSAFYDWKASLEVAPQVRGLPDPMLTYSYYINEVETRVGPQRQRLTLMQRFPWPSRLDRKAEEAERKARVKQHLYEATKLRLFYDVKKAYYDYYFLARSIAILRDNVKLLERMEAAVRVRYKAGGAESPALIQIQVELGKHEDRLKSREALQPALVARLNAAMGRDSLRPIPWPKRDPVEPPVMEDETLLEALLEKNPELEAARERILAAEAGKDVASTMYFPDFGIGGTYIQTDRRHDVDVDDNGKDAILLTLELSLPIWQGSKDAAVRQAEAEQEAAWMAHEDLENRLSAALSVAFYQYEDAERTLNLFRETLVPLAEQAFQTIQAAFTGGKASYLDMLEAERQLLEFRLMVERSLVDRNVRLAELEKLCGRELRGDN